MTPQLAFCLAILSMRKIGLFVRRHTYMYHTWFVMDPIDPLQLLRTLSACLTARQRFLQMTFDRAFPVASGSLCNCEYFYQPEFTAVTGLFWTANLRFVVRSVVACFTSRTWPAFNSMVVRSPLPVCFCSSSRLSRIDPFATAQ